MTERIIWQSPCGNAETVRDGAKRFVLEIFDSEARVTFGDGVGEFRFDGGHWYVRRMTDKLTPKAKARVKGRMEFRK